MTDRLPAVGYIFHKSVPCAKMRPPLIDSDTIHNDRELSDHDGTYVTIGFLPGYSTTHQLIELNDDILLALDKKQITSITFADISKSL